jgi:hypothetical protein
MRKLLAVVALGLSFVAGALLARNVHDWHDLDEVHKHVGESTMTCRGTAQRPRNTCVRLSTSWGWLWKQQR